MFFVGFFSWKKVAPLTNPDDIIGCSHLGFLKLVDFYSFSTLTQHRPRAHTWCFLQSTIGYNKISVSPLVAGYLTFFLFSVLYLTFQNNATNTLHMHFLMYTSGMSHNLIVGFMASINKEIK